MIKIKKINILVALLSILAFATSCESYLDTMPDDRAEVNSTEKVQQLLVSAYPNKTPDLIFYMSSDDVTDNGKQYVAQPNQDQMYRWQEVETTSDDDPYGLWNGYYYAIGTANEALKALDGMEATPDNNALRAEALLCRAYGMFLGANTFCMAYNPEHADDYMGLPYPKVAGESVDERGTLGELYANINADIEEALPMLNDNMLGITPKYHFNTKAAYAFAARFNLYYMNYDKAIEYATKALGSNASSLLRDMSSYATLAGLDDIANAYIRSGQSCNFMMLTGASTVSRATWASSFTRYAHNMEIIANETFWAKTPWSVGPGIEGVSASANNALCEARLVYGNNQQVYYPKMMEMFEVTDKVNQTGYVHIVDAVFTADETILVRAEAYALKGNTTAALADMNAWLVAHTDAVAGTQIRPTLTDTNLNAFFDALPEVPSTITTVMGDLRLNPQRGIKKPLHPQGFTVAAGTQTNLIYCILQMRRIETWEQGTRFLDIKRYGIEYSHALDGEQPITFKAGDLRGAIQLPQDVIKAGLPANPRN